MIKYVAYYRVSTAKQGRSGLGLEAQKETVQAFVKKEEGLIGEYVEVQSGRKDNREELRKAIKAARSQNAKIVIARLDRFSRKVSFISNFMEQGVSLVVAEMPYATDFQLHIFAALAQEERRLISGRTKAALSQAVKKGRILGINGAALAARNKEQFITKQKELRILVPHWRCFPYSTLADYLNNMDIKTIAGHRFCAASARRYFKD